MSFKITQETDQDLNLLEISDLSSGIRVRVLPSYGAAIHEYSIPLCKERIPVISGYESLADLNNNFSRSYKSAKLSPFVCRLADGKYRFNGECYEFNNKFSDGSAIHGILFNKSFTVTEKIELPEEASLTMEYTYRREDQAYPFDYRIIVRYVLKTGGRLYIETTVENLSPTSIPVSDGWHPYFSLGGKTNDWLLSFRSRNHVIFDRRLIPVGHLQYTDAYVMPKLIGQDFFDDCFLLDANTDKPAATLENPLNGLRLSVFADQTYRYLQIYTPEDRKSIAIENLSSAPDSFNNGMGLIVLEPGQIQSFQALYKLDFV
jgi:aldose 1-epimerase